MKVFGYRSKKPWKMGCATFLYGFVLVVILIAIINPSSEKEAQKELAASVEETNKFNGLTQDQKIRKIIEDTIGLETNMGKNRFIGGGITEAEETIKIDLLMSDNFTLNTTKGSALSDTVDAFEKFYELIDTDKGLLFEWYISQTDDYGKEAARSAMKILLNKEIHGELNWENKALINIDKVAEFYWQHPSFE